MVAAAATAVHSNPSRPPLTPSDRDNSTAATSAAADSAAARRPRTKQITSRCLSSSSSTSSTSSSSSGERRYASPSPVAAPRASSPPALRAPPAASRRSSSTGRVRPDLTPSATARVLAPTTTTTRSLSVSFQGESFFYQTSKAKAPTPERRRPSTPTRTAKPAATPEVSRSFERWPAARPRLNCLPDTKELAVPSAVRSFQRNSNIFDRDASPRRAGDLSTSSDSDSTSSGSNPEVPEPPASRPISTPARFRQETNSRRREAGAPLSSSAPKALTLKKSMGDCPPASPRSVSSPISGPIRASSPSRLVDAKMRGAGSPLRVRCGSPSPQPGPAPSIISFAAEVRRSKKGESRIEEAHLLRLLHNRQLQWRFVNARCDAVLMLQRMAVEKKLYNAWRTISGMRDTVTTKRIKLQLLTQTLKVTSILEGLVIYLEEWSLMEGDHSSCLSEAIEALEACTLLLPVVGGARIDIQEVKNAVCSAVDVMQAMGSSVCSLLPKAEHRGSLVSELAELAAQEQALLEWSRELLSQVANLNVTQSSLQGHIIQLTRGPSKVQL